MDVFEEIAEEFSNPASLALKVGQSLVFHGMEIYGEVTDSISQWHDGNFEAFGKDLGETASLILLGKKAEQSNFDALKYVEILDGLVQGIFLSEEVTTVETCVTDINSVAVLLDKGIMDYVHGDVTKGTVALGRALT